jgi:hypothetical protein
MRITFHNAEDLDPAILDRVDEQLEVALPSRDLREQILQLYFTRYLVRAHEEAVLSWGARLRRTFGGGVPDRIDTSTVDQVRPSDFTVRFNMCGHATKAAFSQG